MRQDGFEDRAARARLGFLDVYNRAPARSPLFGAPRQSSHPPTRPCQSAFENRRVPPRPSTAPDAASTEEAGTLCQEAGNRSVYNPSRVRTRPSRPRKVNASTIASTTRRDLVEQRLTAPEW